MFSLSFIFFFVAESDGFQREINSYGQIGFYINRDVLWTLYHEWTHTFQWDHLLGLILDFVQEIDEADFNQSKAAQETGGLIGFFIEALARLVSSYLFGKHYPQIAKNGPGGGEPTKPQEIALSHLVGEYIEDRKPVDIQFLKEFWRVSRDANYDVL